MKLILWATVEEAEASLSYLNAQAVETNLWCYSEGWMVVTGWGCKNAYDACLKYATKATEIWNLGIAGALRNGFELGSIHTIHTVGKQEEPSISLNLDGLRLVSSDIPVHDPRLRKRLNREWDLVDMEGYGVALAANKLGKKCQLVKLVSDFAKPDTRELIKKNMSRNSEKLAEVICQR